MGLASKVQKSRKQMKERKNRSMKIRGVKKVRKMSARLNSTPGAIEDVSIFFYNYFFVTCSIFPL